MMKELEVKTYPDPSLRTKTEKVVDFNSEISEIIKKMADIMYLSGGVGLAATQVGLDISLIVIDSGNGLIKFINPEIKDLSENRTPLIEGCLSLPDINVQVSRPEQIEIQAQNEFGDIFIRSFYGLEAKILQHELDHLQGRIILDYLGPLRKQAAKLKLIAGNIRKSKLKKSCEVICNVRKYNK